VEPNTAHKLLAELENRFRVSVITQNVDDLHERAGSSHVLHLHGELRWACSSRNKNIREFLGSRDIEPEDKAADGSSLRPDIVWFGEAVPKMEEAIELVLSADIFLLIGSSLQVYPAAGLMHYVPVGKPVYIIDPNHHGERQGNAVKVIQENAVNGMKLLYNELTET
jgi:NAD-dependent deacetylase